MTGFSGGGQAPYSVQGKSSEDLIRELRIVWFGLLMGQVMFAGVILVIGPLWKEPGTAPLAIPLAALLGLMVIGSVVASIVFERAFVSRVRERSAHLKQSADPLPGAFLIYKGFFIVRMALVESTGFFGFVTYLVTAALPVLTVPALAVVWFVANLPTEDRVRRRIQNALESA